MNEEDEKWLKLYDRPTWEKCDCPHCTEARVEIERLRLQRDEFTKLINDLSVEVERLEQMSEKDYRSGWKGGFEKGQAEIKRLQELLRGVGANRYWEGRWRDAQTEILRIEQALDMSVRKIESQAAELDWAHKLLEEGK